MTHPKEELLQNVVVASGSKRKYRTPGSEHLIVEDVRRSVDNMTAAFKSYVRINCIVRIMYCIELCYEDKL